MSANATWVPWHFSKWIIGTAELDHETEYVYFRLCMFAYEAWDAKNTSSDRLNAARCKVDPQKFADALSLLIETEKVERLDDGSFIIPSVHSRINEATSTINARQIGAAKSRLRRELRKEGKSDSAIDLIISEKFPDDQPPTDRQTDKQTNRQTDTQLTLVPPSDDEAGDVRKVFAEWNILAGDLGLPKATALNDTRRKHIRARIKDAGSADKVIEVMRKVRESRFLCGKTNDFSASLDFVLKASSFQKLAEGAYANRVRDGGNNAVEQSLRRHME